MMATRRSGWLWVLLASSALLAGCAQTDSASAGGSGGSWGAIPSCRGQNANADCYGGGPQ